MSQEPRKRRKVAHDPQAVFQCTYPGCGSSYRRKEHLNRHAQQHTKEPKFVCTYCARKFFRRSVSRRPAADTISTHMPLGISSAAIWSCTMKTSS